MDNKTTIKDIDERIDKMMEFGRLSDLVLDIAKFLAEKNRTFHADVVFNALSIIMCSMSRNVGLEKETLIESISAVWEDLEDGNEEKNS